MQHPVSNLLYLLCLKYKQNFLALGSKVYITTHLHNWKGRVSCFVFVRLTLTVLTYISFCCMQGGWYVLWYAQTCTTVAYKPCLKPWWVCLSANQCEAFRCISWWDTCISAIQLWYQQVPKSQIHWRARCWPGRSTTWIFRLFLSEMAQISGMFQGWPDCLSPVSNSQAVADKMFSTCGKVLASMIVQGCQAPHCFSTPVADFIFYGEVHCPENLEYIPDREIQEKLKVYTHDHSCILEKIGQWL